LITGCSGELTNYSSSTAKMPVTSWIKLFDMTDSLMHQPLSHIRKGIRMIKSLVRVQKLAQFRVLEVLLVQAPHVAFKPIVQLLQVEEVLAADLDRVPDFFNRDEIRVFDDLLVEDLKPEFHASDRIVLECDFVAFAFFEWACEEFAPIIVAGGGEKFLPGDFESTSSKHRVFAIG
jgi:hypothetical protein